MLIPLKKKYKQGSAKGHKSKSSNGVPKPKSIWKKLQENAKKRGK